MVAVAVQAATARMILVVMAPSAGTMRVVSPHLVRSYGGNGATDVQEPSVVEPSVEELCVEKPFHFR
jgi:hypothetical protein